MLHKKILIFLFIYLLLPLSLSRGLLAESNPNIETDSTGKDSLYQLLVEKIGITEDQQLLNYTNKIADKIVLASKTHSSYKKTLVINTPEIMALTNFHYVFISTGLIALLNNEAELAAIISHEIAHIISDHKNKGKEIIEQLLAYQKAHESENYSDFTTELSRTYVLLEIQRNRRQFEDTADKAAINYLLSGNYDPYAYISALKKIELTIDNSFAEKNMQNKIISELLSTHPPISERMKNITKILNSYNANTLHFRNYRDRFIYATNNMTLFTTNTQGVPKKYIIRYVDKLDLDELKNDKELLDYILLLNQAASLHELNNMGRIKGVFREK